PRSRRDPAIRDRAAPARAGGLPPPAAPPDRSRPRCSDNPGTRAPPAGSGGSAARRPPRARAVPGMPRGPAGSCVRLRGSAPRPAVVLGLDRGRPALDRDLDREYRAATGPVRRPDAAAVRFDQRARDREPETDTAALAVRATIELVEHPALFTG